MSARLARLALALYPLGYRRRYGEEMATLVEDQGASPRVVADLARGAFRAHLRPEPGVSAAVGREDRMRLGVSAVLLCWLVAAGAILAFAKTTEGPAFRAAASAHAPLGAAYTALGVCAAVASMAFLLGAAPLVAVALAQAKERSAVRRAALAAFGSVAILIAATGALVFLANQEPAPGESLSAALLTGWIVVGAACALGCALAARRGLFAAAVPPSVLRFAAACAGVVAVAMIGIALATLAYLVSLVSSATGLAAAPNGPLGNPDVRASLVLVLAMMVAASVPAGLAARRAWRGAGEN
ncbi:MAG: hypothetical protein JST53_07265 [Actinobacteria bacterium]|nr:hypothetical protein [Actinomycetota bacterium]